MLLLNGISDNACIGSSTQLLQQDHMIGNQLAKEAMHGQVECRVIILNSFDELADGNIRVELFFYFAHKGFLRRFTELHFAAGEFPSSCKITVLLTK